jgi:hypothetical protein
VVQLEKRELARCGARFSTAISTRGMPLDPMHVRLKLLHACDQWHSSRASTPLTGCHCKLRPNTEGKAGCYCRKNVVLTMNSATTLMTSYNTEGKAGCYCRKNVVDWCGCSPMVRCTSLSISQHSLATNEGMYNVGYYDGTVHFPLYQPTLPSNQWLVRLLSHGTVCVFRQRCALEAVIEFHAFALLEALSCV